MRAFAILVALLLSPLAAAISDLSIYSEAKYSSQSEAPILVEWFHGPDDESKVQELAEMDKLLFFIGELVLKKRAVVYLMMMLILG